MHIEPGDAGKLEAALTDIRKCDVHGAQDRVPIHRTPDDVRIWEFHVKALLDVLQIMMRNKKHAASVNQQLANYAELTIIGPDFRARSMDDYGIGRSPFRKV